MKKFIIGLMLLFSISISAQIVNFKTTGYYEKHKYSWGWGNWSSRQSSNMLISINFSTDIVTIYSPKIQIYSIFEYLDTNKDSDGDITTSYKFYDQDEDIGIMRLVLRSSGKSQIYIDFANISWAYDVYKLNY